MFLADAAPPSKPIPNPETSSSSPVKSKPQSPRDVLSPRSRPMTTQISTGDTSPRAQSGAVKTATSASGGLSVSGKDRPLARSGTELSPRNEVSPRVVTRRQPALSESRDNISSPSIARRKAAAAAAAAPTHDAISDPHDPVMVELVNAIRDWSSLMWTS